jgi:hypothetical protein
MSTFTLFVIQTTDMRVFVVQSEVGTVSDTVGIDDLSGGVLGHVATETVREAGYDAAQRSVSNGYVPRTSR